MLIRVADIPETGILVDSVAEFWALYPEEGWRLERIRLAGTTPDVYVSVMGDFATTARLTCSHCLEHLAVRVHPQVAVQLVPAPRVRRAEVELSPDDLETDFYAGESLDLSALLRSET